MDRNTRCDPQLSDPSMPSIFANLAGFVSHGNYKYIANLHLNGYCFDKAGVVLPSSVQIVVVADDLTGALDAVAPFATAGLRCVVAIGPDKLATGLQQVAEVIAVSTNSRDLPAADAAAVVRSVAMMLQGVPVVFKKIDSRLKGNVAAEVSALAQVLQLKRILLCPAIPEMGRIVVGGQLSGFGVAEPSDVAAVLKDQAGLTPLAPDAQTDAEIDALLAALLPKTLLVGARGLSAGLARRMHRAAIEPVELPLPQPIAFAVGSRDPITLAQVEVLRQSQPQAEFLPAPNGRFAGLVPAASVVVMQATQGDRSADPKTVTQALAAGFTRKMAAGRACLVLTGGETAAAVLAEMGIGLLSVLGEALHGLPLCRALDLADAPLIVAKSGGFGAPDTLKLLVQPKTTLARPSNEEG